MTSTTPPTITSAELVEVLRGARSVLALTGAGVSVASGLPTYRGATDSRYEDPEALRWAMARTLEKDPDAWWRGYRERLARFEGVEPNAAHRALAGLESCLPRTLLATQNVDGLHHAAGSRRVVELHGALHRVRCSRRGCEAEPRTCPVRTPAGDPPLCELCDAPLRADIVLFGEGADWRWDPVREFLSEPLDVVLHIGTSGTVAVPDQLDDLLIEAGRRPRIYELNPQPMDRASPRLPVAGVLRLGAEVALPEILAGLQAK